MSCCICLDDTEKPIKKLDCQHSFHNECIEEWKKTSKTCPICRREIKNKNNPKLEKFLYIYCRIFRAIYYTTFLAYLVIVLFTPELSVPLTTLVIHLFLLLEALE